MPVISLAENSRTQIKAGIKRASAKARREMGKLDKVARRRLGEAYLNARNDLTELIRSYGDNNGSLRLEVMRDLVGQIDQRLNRLAKLNKTLLDDELLRAAALGSGPYSEVATRAMLTRVAHDAALFVQTFVANDGLQLSDRLWNIDRNAKQTIGNAVENAIIRGQSASAAAQEFLDKGAPVPRDIAKKMGLASAERVARIAGRSLMTGEMNPYDQARRLFRTEINRAHGEAYMGTGEAVEDFGGWRFLLSPRHPTHDICDMHASVNRYGLGPGVYPDRDRNPWPAHPNTLSYVEIVFADEITDEDKKGKEDRLAWLKRQPPLIQEQVLGSKMKRGALNYGALKENQITAPWNVLKKRYEGQGIPVDKLKEALSTKVEEEFTGE